MAPSFVTSTSEYDRAKIPSVASLDEFSGVKTDWGSAFSDYACFTKELIKPTEMPAGHGVLDVFRICFDDKTPLLAEYHAKRNDSAQNCEDWRATTDGQPFRGQRQFTCTTLVKAMMGKACPYTEYQRYAFFNVGGTTPTLLVQFSSQISGVMFSDAFRAEALVVFTQAGSGEAATVTMRAYGYVQFLRSVWVKGKIQSKTLDDELPASYGTLATMIKETLAKSGEGGTTAPTALPSQTAAEAQGDNAMTTATSASAASVAALPPSASGTPENPALRAQTLRERRVCAAVSFGLACLVLLCTVRGIFSAVAASLPQNGVVCHVVLGSAHSEASGRAGSAAVAGVGRRVCTRVSDTERHLLHCLRAPLLVFQLLAALVFVGVLARIVTQL